VGYRQNLDKWLRVSERRRLLDADLEKVRDRMVGRTLEIGCGRSGRRGEFVPPQTESWTCVDISANVAPHALCTVESLPFQSGSFDTVVCLEVFEYVDSPESALREIRRALKQGGSLVFAIPFLHRMDTAEDKWRLTANGIRKLMNENGFSVKESFSQGAAFSVAVNILKYSIHSHPSARTRMWLGGLLRPIFVWMNRLETGWAKKIPTIETFTTGYLVLAEAV
jgi:SAM-dependent methyltransferase